MSKGNDKIDYDEARADAIEERIERLRRLHGWTTDTVNVKPQEASALRDDQKRQRAPKPTLVMRYTLPGEPETRVEIDDDHFDVGAGERSKVRILHPSIAARHCRISRDDEAFRVRDMNTQTGTWVNDSRIPLSSALADGDVLRIGDIELLISFKIPGQPAAQPETSKTRPQLPEPRPPIEPRRAREAQPPPSAPAPEPVAPHEEEFGSETMFVSREDLDRRVTPRPREAAPPPSVASKPLPLQAFIVYTDQDGIEREAEIPEDRPLVVGRRSTSDLRLADSSISGRHAAFEWVDDDVVVRDLGSTNGTWIEGDRVPRAVLSDKEVVRLGLVPVKIRLVFDESMVPVAAPPPAEVAPEPATVIPHAAPPPEAPHVVHAPTPPRPSEPRVRTPRRTQQVVEEGPPSGWHLLYVTDERTVAAVSMGARNACIVAGEVDCEISVHDRGLKPEHLQFDFTPKELTVMQARGDALLKINNNPVTEGTLNGGEVVSAGSLDIRVVRGVGASQANVVGGWSEAYDFWARAFKDVDPALELLMIDAEASGGRAELSIWGDGAARVELFSGDSQSERYEASLDPQFQRLLLSAIARAGFPDVPEDAPPSPSGPELHAFIAEERATVVMGDWLAAKSSPWRVVRDLLRAVVDQILG